MAHIHYFNPENDIALQRGCGRFTAPKAARLIATAGAFLPAFYGEPGCKILPNKYVDKSAVDFLNNWAENIHRILGKEINIVNDCKSANDKPEVWGWSEAIKQDLEALGYPSELLPDSRYIDIVRRISHRRTSIPLTELLAERLNHKLAIPIECFSVNDAQRALDQFGHTFFKLPHSCSGRGVFDSTSFSPTQLKHIIEQGIAAQGSIMAEKAHEKLLDFAIICDCRKDKVTIKSLSVFHSGENGVYKGNIVASDTALNNVIASYTGLEKLEHIKEIIPETLEELIAGKYEGIAGIDMLVADSKEGIYIHPCVEINFRKTMGYAAGQMYHNLLAPGSKGLFELDLTCADKISGQGLITDSGKIITGTLYLTPPYPASPRFCLTVGQTDSTT